MIYKTNPKTGNIELHVNTVGGLVPASAAEGFSLTEKLPDIIYRRDDKTGLVLPYYDTGFAQMSATKYVLTPQINPVGKSAEVTYWINEDGTVQAEVAVKIYIYKDEHSEIDLEKFAKDLQKSLNDLYSKSNDGKPFVNVLKPAKDIAGNKVEKRGSKIKANAKFMFAVTTVSKSVALEIANKKKETANFFNANNLRYNRATGGNSGLLDITVNPVKWAHEVAHVLGWSKYKYGEYVEQKKLIDFNDVAGYQYGGDHSIERTSILDQSYKNGYEDWWLSNPKAEEEPSNAELANHKRTIEKKYFENIQTNGLSAEDLEKLNFTEPFSGKLMKIGKLKKVFGTFPLYIIYNTAAEDQSPHFFENINKNDRVNSYNPKILKK